MGTKALWAKMGVSHMQETNWYLAAIEKIYDTLSVKKNKNTLLENW